MWHHTCHCAFGRSSGISTPPQASAQDYINGALLFGMALDHAMDARR
jgi:hypothetical protein